MAKLLLKKNIKKKVGKAEVTTQHSKAGKAGPEITTQEDVGNYTAEVGAMVGVEMSLTHNLGDYNSVRFQVSLQMPAPIDAIDDAYEGSKIWVENRLNELVEGLE